MSPKPKAAFKTLGIKLGVFVAELLIILTIHLLQKVLLCSPGNNSKKSKIGQAMEWEKLLREHPVIRSKRRIKMLKKCFPSCLEKKKTQHTTHTAMQFHGEVVSTKSILHLAEVLGLQVHGDRR